MINITKSCTRLVSIMKLRNRCLDVSNKILSPDVYNDFPYCTANFPKRALSSQVPILSFSGYPGDMKLWLESAP